MNPPETKPSRTVFITLGVAIIAIIIALAAFAKVQPICVSDAIKSCFDALRNCITSLGYPLPRLIIVMSICGGIGAFVHALVVGERSLLAPGKKRNESTGAVDLQFGFLSDLLVGAVAANVLHFPLAAVFDYTGLLSTDPASNAKPYLSIISLALLAGYTGPTLLDALAQKFKDSVVARLEERLQRTESMVARTLSAVLEEVLTRRISLNETERSLLKAKFEDVRAIEIAEGPEKLGALDALFAGYFQIEIDNFPEAVRYLELTDGNVDELTKPQQWAAKYLLGLAYHSNLPNQPQWFEKASQAYTDALNADPTPLQQARTITDVGTINHDKGNRDEALKKWKEALEVVENLPPSEESIASDLHIRIAAFHTEDGLAPGGKRDECLAKAKEHLLEIPKPSEVLLEDGNIPGKYREAWKTIDGLPEEWMRLL